MVSWPFIYSNFILIICCLIGCKNLFTINSKVPGTTSFQDLKSTIGSERYSKIEFDDVIDMNSAREIYIVEVPKLRQNDILLTFGEMEVRHQYNTNVMIAGRLYLNDSSNSNRREITEANGTNLTRDELKIFTFVKGTIVKSEFRNSPTISFEGYGASTAFPNGGVMTIRPESGHLSAIKIDGRLENMKTYSTPDFAEMLETLTSNEQVLYSVQLDAPLQEGDILIATSENEATSEFVAFAEVRGYISFGTSDTDISGDKITPRNGFNFNYHMHHGYDINIGSITVSEGIAKKNYKYVNLVMSSSIEIKVEQDYGHLNFLLIKKNEKVDVAEKAINFPEISVLSHNGGGVSNKKVIYSLKLDRVRGGDVLLALAEYQAQNLTSGNVELSSKLILGTSKESLTGKQISPANSLLISSKMVNGLIVKAGTITIDASMKRYKYVNLVSWAKKYSDSEKNVNVVPGSGRLSTITFRNN